MTRWEILFNYNQAIKQANKMDNLARQLTKLSNDKMEDTMRGLKQAWQSDNSPGYYNKLGKVQGDIKTSADNAKKIAEAIRTTAEAVRRAELRALEIAKKRSYK